MLFLIILRLLMTSITNNNDFDTNFDDYQAYREYELAEEQKLNAIYDELDAYYEQRDDVAFVNDILSKLSDDITALNLSRHQLKIIPRDCLLRFKNLKRLDLSYNCLQELPNIPESVNNLNCSFNSLTRITCTQNLERLFCHCNQLVSIDSIPDSLEFLYCYTNKLTSLPPLPKNIKYVDKENNLF